MLGISDWAVSHSLGRIRTDRSSDSLFCFIEFVLVRLRRWQSWGQRILVQLNRAIIEIVFSFLKGSHSLYVTRLRNRLVELGHLTYAFLALTLGQVLVQVLFLRSALKVFIHACLVLQPFFWLISNNGLLYFETLGCGSVLRRHRLVFWIYWLLVLFLFLYHKVYRLFVLALQLHHLLLQLLDVGRFISQILDVLLYNVLILGLKQLLLLLG